MPGVRPGAVREHQRQYAEDERERRHEDGPQSKAGGFHGRFQDSTSLAAKPDREFDDEDRVLRRQPEEHQQSDLAVDVEGEAAPFEGEDRPEDRERHREDDDERNRPALVERGEHEEDHDQRDEEDVRLDVAGFDRLVDGAGPLVLESRRGQDRGRDRFHRDLDLAARVSLRGPAHHHRGVVVVVVRDVVGRDDLVHRRELTDRNRFAVAVHDSEPTDVLRRHPVDAFGLQDHLIDLVVFVPVVDVEASPTETVPTSN